jgi:hypothetical protein
MVGMGLGMRPMGRRRRSLAPTLKPLTLSASSVVENSAAGTVIGAIQGRAAGSTLSIVSQSNANWFAIDGGNLVVGSVSPDYETAASATVTMRETLTGAIGSPKDTVLTVTVADVVEGMTFVAGVSGTNTGISTNFGFGSYVSGRLHPLVAAAAPYRLYTNGGGWFFALSGTSWGTSLNGLKCFINGVQKFTITGVASTDGINTYFSVATADGAALTSGQSYLGVLS